MTADERPKDSLGLAIDLFDELAGAIHIRSEPLPMGLMATLAELEKRRAALQPRLDRRRENQAKERDQIAKNEEHFQKTGAPPGGPERKSPPAQRRAPCRECGCGPIDPHGPTCSLAQTRPDQWQPRRPGGKCWNALPNMLGTCALDQGHSGPCDRGYK